MEQFTNDITTTLNSVSTSICHGIQSLVSKDKYRFQKDDFDLDLTYITERLIAMALPANSTTLTSAYRNNLDEVSKFFNHYHKDHYLIINLSQISYDYSKLNNKVIDLGWPDHHSPSLELLFQILQVIESFMVADPKNVVAVHCKAGRGRTGVVIASYFLYSKLIHDSESAVTLFAQARSATQEGIEIPSQLRAVSYVGDILKNNINIYTSKKVYLDKIIMKPLPTDFYIDTKEHGVHTFFVEVVDLRTYGMMSTKSISCSRQENGCLIIDISHVIDGDIEVRFKAFGGPLSISEDVELFRFAFNTHFIKDMFLDLKKSDLDSGSNRLTNLRFDPNFILRVMLKDKEPVTKIDSEYEAYVL